MVSHDRLLSGDLGLLVKQVLDGEQRVWGCITKNLKEHFDHRLKAIQFVPCCDCRIQPLARALMFPICSSQLCLRILLEGINIAKQGAEGRETLCEPG